MTKRCFICILAALGLIVSCCEAAIAKKSGNIQKPQEPAPYRTVLTKELKWLADSHSTPENLETYEPTDITVRRIPPTTLMQKMLPGYHFYRIVYTHKRRADRPYGKYHVVLDLSPVESYEYLISPTGKHYKYFGIGTKDDDFFRLLQADQIKIRSANDAQRVWNLYQDLCQAGGENLRRLPHRQLSATLWEFNSGIWEGQDAAGKPTFSKLTYLVKLYSNKTVASIREHRRQVKGQ